MSINVYIIKYHAGREFRAIFVSTTEATDENGRCKNPTKSMTDPFVFNTVVTRAQSLVVCVGNPYFLCRLEESTKPGQKHWSTYINYCLDCETFTIHNSSLGQMENERLQNFLNPNTDRYFKQELKSGDKIIKGYLNSLAQFENHKRVLKFSKSWGEYHWDDEYDDFDEGFDDDDDDNDDDDDDDDDDDGDGDGDGDDDDDDDDDKQNSTLYSHLGSCIKCIIDICSWHQALAQSVKNPSLIIHINGQKNLRGAFHGSTVLVEIIDCASQQKGKNEKTVYNGKVVKLISLINFTFLCEADNQNLHQFYPVNKKDPVFYNLPMLSKTEDGVAVFDSQSLKELPRITQVIPRQIARKRIFIVQYLFWDCNNHKFPVGVVIGSISKGYTYNAGEKLLCAQYEFDFAKIKSNFNFVKQVHPDNYDEVFAIIEKSDEILENAFSIQSKDKDTYIVNYYVVNIAKSIEDQQLTDLLKSRGVSAFVKTDKLNKWKLHSMFPLPLLEKLNFNFTKPCPCFRISCLAEKKGGNITYKPLEVSIEEVFGLLTKTYTLQQMESQIETCLDLSLLFYVAQCLQLKKLDYPVATYKCVFDIFETPRAQLVLQVFSSWANSLVSMKLAESSLSLFPLHRKLPPNSKEKQLVYDNHGDALQTSLHNKYFLPKNGYKPLSNVKINSKALPLLIEALKDRDTFKYLAMLAYDNFFPQLHVASHKFESIEKAREFVLCSNTDKINFEVSHEYTYYTTQFTSPLTSFFDIVMQDMLTAALNSQSSKYKRDELNLMCVKANTDFKRKTAFEQSVFNLQLGVTLKTFNHRIDGYIERINNKNQLLLTFPSHELKSLSEHQSSFNIAHLLALKGTDTLKSITLYKWNVIVASFDGPPSIFTSPTIILDRVKDADATMDITVFVTSNEEEKSNFYAELNKKQLNGSVESSTVSVNQDEWQKLTKLVSESAEGIDDYCENAVKLLSSCCIKHSQKKKTQQIINQTVFWSGTVSKKLQQKYDPLHTWFGAAQDTALIYPKIQQIEITPFLKICIQHNSEPEKCFANISLVNASKETYEDINEYMELWGQVVIAENAVSSVRTRDILLLENVYLQWPELEHCCDSYAGDHYRVPKDEFVIMKLPVDFSQSNIELFDLQRGDLLCVQYEVPDKKLEISMGFVFHMFIEKVSIIDVDTESSDSDEDSDYESTEDLFSEDNIQHEKTYFLSFSHSNEKISEKFKHILTHKPSCKVQILHISPPQRFVTLVCTCVNMFLFRRIYRYLRKLHRSSQMTQDIACRDTAAITKTNEGFSILVSYISFSI